MFVCNVFISYKVMNVNAKKLLLLLRTLRITLGSLIPKAITETPYVENMAAWEEIFQKQTLVSEFINSTGVSQKCEHCENIIFIFCQSHQKVELIFYRFITQS